MRTTLDIDNHILLAVKEIAWQRKVSMGPVQSELAREALIQRTAGSTHHGVPLFPVRPGAGIVNMELVTQLLDEIS